MSLHTGYLYLALKSLRSARLRSGMTMLGIVIGVLAVIVIVGIGEGVKQQIGTQVARYGKNILLVRAQQPGEGLGDGLPRGAGALLSSADLEVIRKVQGVQSAVPLSTVSGTVGADHEISNPLVIATTPELHSVLNKKIEYGDFFTTADGEHVAVLGSAVAHRLFDDTAPLGQKVTFRGAQFVVAGVFKPFIAAPFSLEANYNEAVFIPYGTAQSLLGTAPAIEQIFIKTSPGADAQGLSRTVQNALRGAHGGASDAVVLPPGSKVASTDQTLHLLTLMTVAVAAVALIVGGVGIMNMMLVSVTERIHEIGLRKAIGATNQQILRQFMAEAVVLSGIGACLGVVGALAVIGLLRVYTSLQPVVVWNVVAVSMLVAVMVGVFFGSIPALKAARMDPIEALRHE